VLFTGYWLRVSYKVYARQNFSFDLLGPLVRVREKFEVTDSKLVLMEKTEEG
jgi:hypothetical protein